MAAQNAHAGLCRMLVERGAVVCMADARGKTPLHYAAESGAAEVLSEPKPCRIVGTQILLYGRNPNLATARRARSTGLQ